MPTSATAPSPCDEPSGNDRVERRPTASSAPLAKDTPVTDPLDAEPARSDPAAISLARRAMAVLLAGVVLKGAAVLFGGGVGTAAGTVPAAAVFMIAALMCRGLAVDETATARLRLAPPVLVGALAASVATLLGPNPNEQPELFAAGSALAGIALAVGAAAFCDAMRRWFGARHETTARRWWTTLTFLVLLGYGIMSIALAAVLVTTDPGLLAELRTGDLDPADPGAELAVIAMVGFVAFLVALVQLVVEIAAAVAGLKALRRASGS